MEGEDFEDSMDESVLDKNIDVSQTTESLQTTDVSQTTDATETSSTAAGQPKIYHRWTVKGYWQDKHKHSLPDGWCEVFHTSGFPLYFHKQTRVVSLSRPYFLGSTSVRHHLIPVTAIPCLYMKRLQEEMAETDETTPKCPFESASNEAKPNGEQPEVMTSRKRKHSDEDVEEGEISSPRAQKLDNDTSQNRPSRPQPLPVSLQILTNSTLDDSLRFSTLTSDELRTYCQRRFAFEQREFKFFPSLGDKWKYIRQAQIKRREMNTPADAQIIEIKPPTTDSSVTVSATIKTTNNPAQPSARIIPVVPVNTTTASITSPPLTSTTTTVTNNDSITNKKVTIDLYPSKSPIALLQEYALKVLKASVRYDWFTTDVSNSPFGCRVLVGETVYGTGIGRNKRTAKANATEESLFILVPQYKKLQQQQQQPQPQIQQQHQQQQQQQQQQQIATATSKETTSDDKPTDEEGCIDDEESSPSTNVEHANENLVSDPNSNSLLDEYLISDINIYDVCVTLGKPTPYQMLEKSLTYNALTRGESNIKMTMTKKPMYTHITLEIGSEHREEAQAKDKAHAKNLAAQKLLKKLHPHLHTYGSLIRLYEKNADTYKRVRVDDELADIVRAAKKNEPNHALLAKLRDEMLRLKNNKNSIGFNQYAKHIVDVSDDLLGRSTLNS